MVLGSEKYIKEYHTFYKHTGIGMSPFNAWVMLKGLETLGLRVRAQAATAAQVADALAGLKNQGVSRVLFPGRADHPQAELAKRQMSGGSTLVAFELAGGKSAAFRFLNALKIVKLSNNLGDAKSLITHPATTTHQRLKPEDRAALGISDGLVRLSLGLETPADLLRDVSDAVKAAAG